MKPIKLALFSLTFLVAGHSIALSPSSLQWPLRLPVAKIKLGDNMVSPIGNDGSSYFHGGCDLMAPVGTEISSPVGGRVELSYYTVTEKNGKILTQRFPFQKNKDLLEKYKLTTEVLIITKDKHRFEFHHVNPESIPETVIEASKTNKTIKSGDRLGNVINWPVAKMGFDYSHVHYNIISPSGVTLNPQFYSVPLPDHSKPEILSAFILTGKGSPIKITSFNNLPIVDEIILELSDRTDVSPIAQAPTFISYTSSGSLILRDLRKALIDSSGRLPNIFDFLYFSNLQESGVSTSVDYWTSKMYFRLKVQAKAGQSFEIRVEDNYGNRTKVNGSFKP